MRPARHFSDLIVWQLAEQIRIEVFKLTEKPRFSADFKARGQADDAADSVTRNIAEGFGCETHAEFARFLEISRRSLNELHDILHGAELKGHVAFAELTPIRQLSKRLYPAFSGFMAYLKRTPNVRPRRGSPQPKDATDRPGKAPSARKNSRRPPNRGGTDKCRARADERQGVRTDERQGVRTDEREGARTDTYRDRTDKGREARTDRRSEGSH
jgi:four helix bundle protein